MNGTLYVPNGTKEAYKATNGWKDFVFMEEGNGGGGGSTPVIPETKKCEKPTISYRNGKLTFSSGTEGATCVSSITDADMGTYTTNEVQLGVTYNISVYTVNGTEAGSSVSNGGQAQVNTNLQPGTVAIVKIGEKSVKMLI